MKRLALPLLASFLLIASADVTAQCAMCKRNVETNREQGNNRVGKGLNQGILYLMAVPYLMGAIGIYSWMKSRKK
jgi:hypothetical protein